MEFRKRRKKPELEAREKDTFSIESLKPLFVIPENGGTWRLWQYHATNLTLELQEREPQYYIILEECTTSAELCDWIFQVAAKSWATPNLIDYLVQALDDLLNPQANLCFGGQDKEMNVRKHLARQENQPAKKKIRQ